MTSKSCSQVTTKNGSLGWLPDNLNQGRLDYYYVVLVILSVLNIFFFIVVAKMYKYKKVTKVKPDVKHVVGFLHAFVTRLLVSDMTYLHTWQCMRCCLPETSFACAVPLRTPQADPGHCTLESCSPSLQAACNRFIYSGDQ